MGICTRVVPLSEVEGVTVSTWGAETSNLQISVRGDAPLAGKVGAVLAWKYKLMELLGLEDRAPALADPRYRLAAA